jgi:hypothetical protein
VHKGTEETREETSLRLSVLHAECEACNLPNMMKECYQQHSDIPYFTIAMREMLSVYFIHVHHKNVGYLILFLRLIQVCNCPCHWSRSDHFQSTTFRNVVDLRTYLYFGPHMTLWRKIVMAPDGLVGLLVGGMLKTRGWLMSALTTPFGEYCRLSTALPV